MDLRESVGPRVAEVKPLEGRLASPVRFAAVSSERLDDGQVSLCFLGERHRIGVATVR
jgi:hypothetical protein